MGFPQPYKVVAVFKADEVTEMHDDYLSLVLPKKYRRKIYYGLSMMMTPIWR
jgi:hypothetical protein